MYDIFDMFDVYDYHSYQLIIQRIKIQFAGRKIISNHVTGTQQVMRINSRCILNDIFYLRQKLHAISLGSVVFIRDGGDEVFTRGIDLFVLLMHPVCQNITLHFSMCLYVCLLTYFCHVISPYHFSDGKYSNNLFIIS